MFYFVWIMLLVCTIMHWLRDQPTDMEHTTQHSSVMQTKKKLNKTTHLGSEPTQRQHFSEFRFEQRFLIILWNCKTLLNLITLILIIRIISLVNVN